MSPTHDLVIRNGTIVDGSGRERFEGDVALSGGRVAEVGEVSGRGAREIDAEGGVVTPGFVDIHTHYDGQVTWDPQLSPSSWHGVTTVVTGNCGVGFAPARAEERKWLIQLMEGVEDIPGAALAEGIEWEWDSFPAYLDALARRERAIDFAAQVPHGPLRFYVMGERGARHEEASAEEIERMAALVEEGVRAGALGFSTSRTLIHKGSDGEYVPGTFAGEAELLGIGRALARAGWGMFQMTSNHTDMPEEIGWMRRLAAETGCPVSFNLVQTDEAPELWRDVLSELDAARAAGAPLVAQVAARPAGVLMGWETSAHPFMPCPTYLMLAQRPIEERIAELQKPEVRDRLLADEPLDVGEFANFITRSFHKMYRLGEAPDYEPEPGASAAAEAERRGVSPRQVVYDWLMEDGGRGLVYFPIFNYSNGHLDHLRELLLHPGTMVGLGDGGAHCGAICDASIPTYVLTHWARDRARGERIDLETAIRLQTRQTAETYGLADRGLLAPGMKGDVNVLDLDALALEAPRMVHDLPAGGRRLVQRARGYRHTIVSGEVVREGGEPTGRLPGRLVRGPQKDPRAAEKR